MSSGVSLWEHTQSPLRASWLLLRVGSKSLKGHTQGGTGRYTQTPAPQGSKQGPHGCHVGKGWAHG